MKKIRRRGRRPLARIAGIDSGDYLKKLDARSRHQLAGNAGKGTLELLLRLEDAPTAEQREALRSRGCRLRSVIGNIVTASIDAARLKDLAALPFVQNIQLPRALFPESQ